MKNQLWVFCLICILLSSCNLDNGVNDRYEVGVREDIILKMDQVLSPEGPTLEFVFSTSSAEHCAGSGFQHESIRIQDQILIRLINLHKPDTCIGSDAVAIQRVGIASQNGTYELAIDLGQLIHNAGSLIISEESFKLELDSRFGLQIPYLEMKKVPQRTIWGFAYHPQQQAQANAILAAGIEEYASNGQPDPGYYGPFELQESGKVILHTAENIFGAYNFIATFNSDVNTLAELVEDIRLSLPAGSEFRLYAWEGSIF